MNKTCQLPSPCSFLDKKQTLQRKLFPFVEASFSCLLINTYSRPESCVAGKELFSLRRYLQPISQECAGQARNIGKRGFETKQKPCPLSAWLYQLRYWRGKGKIALEIAQGFLAGLLCPGIQNKTTCNRCRTRARRICRSKIVTRPEKYFLHLGSNTERKRTYSAGLHLEKMP